MQNQQMKSKIKVIGLNYLCNHPKAEALLDIPEDTVLILRSEWLEIIKFFEDRPELMSEIGQPK